MGRNRATARTYGNLVHVQELQDGKPSYVVQHAIYHDALERRPEGWRITSRRLDNLYISGRFLGPDRAREAFTAFARRRGLAAAEDLPADAGLVEFAETQLAGAIGGASARDKGIVSRDAVICPGCSRPVNIDAQELPEQGIRVLRELAGFSGRIPDAVPCSDV